MQQLAITFSAISIPSINSLPLVDISGWGAVCENGRKRRRKKSACKSAGARPVAYNIVKAVCMSCGSASRPRQLTLHERRVLCTPQDIYPGISWETAENPSTGWNVRVRGLIIASVLRIEIVCISNIFWRYTDKYTILKLKMYIKVKKFTV